VRSGLLKAASLAALALAVAPAGATAGGARDELVRTYSPITMLRTSDSLPCDDAAEQYEPTTVDVVLGNPDVDLISPPGDDTPPLAGPTAADIADLPKGWYLDLPGDPLHAGCTYAKAFAKLVAADEAPPVTYAHIRRAPGDDELVVQYWFYYYFNQFNDVHESDWEGMQIIFDATTVRAALEAGPSEIGLFQHGGGERADWTDSKVEKRDTHPVVYPAAGSHATFYRSAIYIENGRKGSGVGCDNSSEPVREVTPRPVAVPTHPAPGSRFEWLTYEGRWGQRESGFNNGPTGPNTKQQWLDPIKTQESLRHSSPVLPGGALLGPAITGAYCGAVAHVTGLLNLAAQTTLGAILLVVGLAILIVFPLTRTRWRPVRLEPLRQERRFGQLVRAARQLYGHHWQTLTVLGLSAAVAVLAIDGVYWLVRTVIDAGLDGLLGSGGGGVTVEGSVISTQTFGAAIASGAVIVFVRELDAGRELGPIATYRELWPRFWRMLGAQLLATIATLALAVTIIGLPIAIWKYIEWQFVQQQVLFEGRGVRDALRGSTRLVRGRWFYTLRVAGFLWLISVVAGPALGVALVFTTLPLWTINLFGSLVFALLIPYVAMARTLLYFDLAAAPAAAPAEPATVGPEPSPAT